MSGSPRTIHSVVGWIVVGVALANWIFWVYRLSAFRKDRRWEGSTFGEPFSLNWEVFNPSNYVPEGRTAFGVLVVSTIAFWAALVAAAYMTWL